MEITRSFGLLLAGIFALYLAASGSRGAEKTPPGYLAYIGTYTTGKSQGIYACRFNAGTGGLTPLGLAAKSTNPSFLAVDSARRFLYAVNEIGNHAGSKSGGVSAFAIHQETGRLDFLNQVSSRGVDPCYVSLDKTRRFVLVANYTSGSVAAFRVLGDGRLGEASAFVQHQGSSVNRERQEGPHAHSIDASPDNRFVLAADLGLDQLLVYRFDPAKGSLEPNDPAFARTTPGAGPRHFAFHPGGRFVYAIDEMGSSVSAFSYDAARGSLRQLQVISTLPKDFRGQNDDAEIEVHPSGRFLYGSNRGHDSIAVFAIDTGTGTLTPVEHVPTRGRTPRSFAIDPTGSYLVVANQDSDNLVVFRIDPGTGRLTATGKVLDVPSPVCIKFVARE